MNIGGIFCRKYSDSALVENRGVLAQFVCHLINDEARRRARGPRVFSASRARFFLIFKNAERNSGDDVIAVRDARRSQFTRSESRGICIDHVHARIIGELPAEIAGKGGIQFEQKQLRIRPHPARNLARMHPFARAVLGNDPRPA